MIYPGVYRAVVVNNQDPAQQGRLLLRVPQIFNTAVTDWAWPCISPGVTALPNNGDPVWVSFEAGDPDYPVWVGTAIWKLPIHTSTQSATARITKAGNVFQQSAIARIQ